MNRTLMKAVAEFGQHKGCGGKVQVKLSGFVCEKCRQSCSEFSTLTDFLEAKDNLAS